MAFEEYPWSGSGVILQTEVSMYLLVDQILLLKIQFVVFPRVQFSILYFS